MASTVDAKLLRQTKFPPEFNRKVDMKKVNVEVMKKWIASKISEILGNEDDVVIELCFNLLEGSRFPDIKALQISLTGFLDKDTARFCKELWSLCLSAQDNPQGVPKELLEAKKLELLQEKIDTEKAAEETRRRKEQGSSRDHEVDIIRQRERAERGRGRGRGDAVRGGRAFDARRPRESRSPPPFRRGSPERRPPPRREVDTYIPRTAGGRRPGRVDRSRTRSSTRSSSRSSVMSSPRRHHHRQRHHSSSLSPPRPRAARRWPNRSVSPRRGELNRVKRGFVSGGDQSRSESYSEYSRSRSPRRRHRASTSPSPSISPSPSPRLRARKRRPSSSSRSRSISRDRYGREVGRSWRSRTSPSYDLPDDRRVSRADIVKDRTVRDDRRLSRSDDRQSHRRRHVRGRTRSRSRSRSRVFRGERKRRRSLERWAPSGRKRRNTSSITSPDDKRRRIADAFGDEDRFGQPPSQNSVSKDMVEKDEETLQSTSQNTVPVSLRPVSKLSANELREKILREKIKASRRAF